MSEDVQSVARVVGRVLTELGVDTVFGLMGSGNMVVTNALIAGGARFHAARHEGGATAMADGWARVTGRVGVVSLHQGPGLTNTLTSLAEAAKSRTPLLIVCGDTQAAALRSNFRIDQHDLVESVGAVAMRVYGAGSAAADAARALRRAQQERRPIVLMLPIDVQTELVAVEAARTPPAIEIPEPPGPRPEMVTRAAEILRGARRPAIIAGRGAVVADAGPELELLGDRIGALLCTSAVAHGLFAGLPYALGIAGGLATPLATELLPRADVLIAVGAGLNHWTTRHGTLVGADTTVVQIDVEANGIGGEVACDLPVIGDAKLTVAALLQALDGPAQTGWRTPEMAQRIAAGRWRDVAFEPSARSGYVDPRTVSLEIARRLPADILVAVDSGHFLGWPAFYFDPPDARSWVFVNAFQAVGLGLGNAIGAAVAAGERLTVAALGDGGTFLALQELETAARLRLRLLVVVYDDAAYGAEVHHFRTLGEDVAFAQFPDVDLAAIAAACGARAQVVRSPGDLAVLDEWLATGAGAGPLVLDAKVDPEVVAEWLEDAFKAD